LSLVPRKIMLTALDQINQGRGAFGDIALRDGGRPEEQALAELKRQSSVLLASLRAETPSNKGDIRSALNSAKAN